MKHETIILFVKFVNNTPKSIFTLRDEKNYTGRVWWTDQTKIEVPTKIWMDEKVNLQNIEWYIKQYQENPKWWNLISV